MCPSARFYYILMPIKVDPTTEQVDQKYCRLPGDPLQNLSAISHLGSYIVSDAFPSCFEESQIPVFFRLVFSKGKNPEFCSKAGSMLSFR